MTSTSFLFYGWHIPEFVVLLAASILVNYTAGRALAFDQLSSPKKKYLLVAVISANIGVLGYFKYANFFLETIALLYGGQVTALKVILPLGISFFTFQQIAYLVDCYAGKTAGRNFVEYAFFVTFFPQLIAGPIVHHKEIIPQLIGSNRFSISAENFAVGLTIFGIGLFKKVIIADTMGALANPGFDSAAAGQVLSFSEAWITTTAFGLEIYFDFSAYSDMVIGIGRMINVNLPINFSSPYQSTNIIDFWRRWHITLSRFLRDYLYIPLGGNRVGKFRRYNNLMIVMVLGGLWHGAGWTYLAWGALHGLYLIINHGWRFIYTRSTLLISVATKLPNSIRKLCCWGTTYVAVTIAWVFFRAENLTAVKTMLAAMAGQTGFQLPRDAMLQFGHVWHFIFLSGIPNTQTIKLGMATFGVLSIIFIVFFCPNTQQIMGKYNRALGHEPVRQKLFGYIENRLVWKPSSAFAIVCALMVVVSILLLKSDQSEFIYFQF